MSSDHRAEYVCHSCGRKMALREGVVGGKTYCHTDGPRPTCYMTAQSAYRWGDHSDGEACGNGS